WVRQKGWHEPATPAISPERLDSFLALRRELRGLDQRAQSLGSSRARQRRPRLDEMPGIMQGVGSLVSDRLQAFRQHDMTPAEDDYLDRSVYERGLPARGPAGADPAARERAAAEVDKAAEHEASPAVRGRLRQIAADLRQSAPAAPEGIPPDAHQLLL